MQSIFSVLDDIFLLGLSKCLLLWSKMMWGVSPSAKSVLLLIPALVHWKTFDWRSAIALWRLSFPKHLLGDFSLHYSLYCLSLHFTSGLTILPDSKFNCLKVFGLKHNRSFVVGGGGFKNKCGPFSTTWFVTCASHFHSNHSWRQIFSPSRSDGFSFVLSRKL